MGSREYALNVFHGGTRIGADCIYRQSTVWIAVTSKPGEKMIAFRLAVANYVHTVRSGHLIQLDLTWCNCNILTKIGDKFLNGARLTLICFHSIALDDFAAPNAASSGRRLPQPVRRPDSRDHRRRRHRKSVNSGRHSHRTHPLYSSGRRLMCDAFELVAERLSYCSVAAKKPKLMD